MHIDEPDDEEVGADQVYAAPASAQAEAAIVLADPTSTDAQKADSLWTLGRSAYYANRVSDAVIYLREALPLAEDPSRRVDIVLTLAPALSKEGEVAAALRLLDPGQADLTMKQRGLLHNQRGILFTEHGRLPEAKAAFLVSLDLLKGEDDSAVEARALVNIGATVSLMGDQDEAEEWYRKGWELTTATGQDVVAAGIEGNLGYSASRRGDFAQALDWYDRARRTFAELGDVDLLVAVLETDYATTLLDIGLDSDAADAARYAVESSRAGGNKILEVHARVLLGEAQLRLNRLEDARLNLQQAREAAVELDIATWAMRAEYLLLRLTTLADVDLAPNFAEDVRELANSLHEAGWEREAVRATHVGAQALATAAGSGAAGALLDWARASIDAGLADPIDVEYSRAFAAHLEHDREAQDDAIAAGLAEVDRQRRMLGSAELQVRLGHRARAFRDLAVNTAIADADARGVVLATDASRGGPIGRPDRVDQDVARLLSELRNVRVGLAEAKLAGSGTAEFEGRIRELERDILQRSRRGSSSEEISIDSPTVDVLSEIQRTDDMTFVCYVRSGDAMWAVQAAAGELELVELGDVEPIRRAARAQGAALRGMARAGEVPGVDAQRVVAANDELDGLLVAPLAIEPGASVVVVPTRLVSGLAWAGLPTFRDSAITIAPSVSVWANGPAELVVGSLGLVGGPALEQASGEVDDLLSLWGSEFATSRTLATTAQAASMLESSNAVHIAAHGSFRSDNPYFSSIEFSDGPLTLLDLERLESMPELVMLASCDGAAGSGGDGNDVVGTTATMIGLGTSVVIAPTVAVNDAAARRFSLDVHRALADEVPVTLAVRDARLLAEARGAPGDTSAAMSFQVHGNRAASSNLFRPGLPSGS